MMNDTNNTLTRALIVDLDGTIADCSHRLHYIATKPKNWPAFDAGIPDDTLIRRTWILIYTLARHHDFHIIFLTGRNERSREATAAWIDKHIGGDLLDLCGGWQLIMRDGNDYRPDFEVKRDRLLAVMGSYEIFAAFEDRGRNIEMMRALGIYVINCAQRSEDF